MQLLKCLLKTCVLLSCLCLLTACGGGNSSSAKVVGKKWTVMVYMAADNDLDIASNLDLIEMKKVGSTPNVTIMVQLDTRNETTKNYLVERDKLTLIEDLGELNMASPEVLKNFIAAGVNRYPADHYALIVWDHGEGWQTSVDKKVSSLIEDWDNGNIKTLPMPNQKVAEGILAAELTTGKHIDILGVDACIMATLEAAYEFRKAADILVASQDLVQGYGWDYKDLFSRLTSNPLMSPRELSTAMVTSYQQFVDSTSWGHGDQAISAVFLGQNIEKVAAETDKFSRSIKTKLDNPSTRDATVIAILDAYIAAQKLRAFQYVDLYDFSMKLDNLSTTAPIRDALKAATIAEYHGSQRPNANGLNIVFINLPEAVRFSAYDFDYTNVSPLNSRATQTAFIKEFGWDEMMNTFFSYKYPDIMK